MAMRNLQWGGALLGLLAVAAVRPVSAAPALTVQSASVYTGSTVSLPVVFDPTTNSVAGINFDLTLPAGLSTTTVAAGLILGSSGANKVVQQNICPQLSAACLLPANTWRFLATGKFDSAYTGSCTNNPSCGNATAIPSGTLLTPTLQVANNASTGTFSVSFSNVAFVDPTANSVTAGTVTAGSLKIFSACDVNMDNSISVTDIFAMVAQMKNPAVCTDNIDHQNGCDVTDVFRVVGAIKSIPLGQCRVGP